MVDVLEKKLGELVQELESQREKLRRDLDKVNAQLDLLSGLVGGRSSATSPRAAVSASAAAEPTKGAPVPGKRRRGRPPKSQSTGATKSAASKTAPPAKRKRGRPPKSAQAAKAAPRAASGESSKSERTLKDELLAIAKTNGGLFRIREASRALVKSGRYEDPVRAAANIQAAIKYYTGNFVKEGSERGLYRAKA